MALNPLLHFLGEPHNELFQYHLIIDLVDVTSLSHQPFAAHVPELLSHHVGPATFAQVQWPEAMTLLLWAKADLL